MAGLCTVYTQQHNKVWINNNNFIAYTPIVDVQKSIKYEDREIWVSTDAAGVRGNGDQAHYQNLWMCHCSQYMDLES